jgi:hypothetical protein
MATMEWLMKQNNYTKKCTKGKCNEQIKTMHHSLLPLMIKMYTASVFMLQKTNFFQFVPQGAKHMPLPHKKNSTASRQSQRRKPMHKKALSPWRNNYNLEQPKHGAPGSIFLILIARHKRLLARRVGREACLWAGTAGWGIRRQRLLVGRILVYRLWIVALLKLECALFASNAEAVLVVLFVALVLAICVRRVAAVVLFLVLAAGPELGFASETH